MDDYLGIASVVGICNLLVLNFFFLLILGYLKLFWTRNRPKCLRPYLVEYTRSLPMCPITHMPHYLCTLSPMCSITPVPHLDLTSWGDLCNVSICQKDVKLSKRCQIGQKNIKCQNVKHMDCGGGSHKIMDIMRFSDIDANFVVKYHGDQKPSKCA